MRSFGSLSHEEAQRLFEAWSAGIELRAERFVAHLRTHEVPVADRPSLDDVATALRWVIPRVQMVSETPDDPQLPLWSVPGPDPRGPTADLPTLLLLDGIAGYYAKALLNEWPNSRLTLYRNRRLGSRDLEHNHWMVSGRKEHVRFAAITSHAQGHPQEGRLNVDHLVAFDRWLIAIDQGLATTDMPRGPVWLK